MAGQTMKQRIAACFQKTTDEATAERFATSWLLSPKWLFLARCLIALYAFVVIFTIIGYERAHNDSGAAGRSFSYFTDLGYWGLAFYFSFAAAHTGSYWRRKRSWLQSWPRALRWMHGVLYCTITVFPFLVTIVFWTILSKGALRTTFSTWSNISKHALNSVIAVFEIILPRTDSLAWLNLIPLIVVLGLYLGLAYLTHATQGFYVYYFLDPRHGRGLVAGVCIGILVGAIIIFAVVHYIISLRKRLTEPNTIKTAPSTELDFVRYTDIESAHGSIGMERVEIPPKQSDRLWAP